MWEELSRPCQDAARILRLKDAEMLNIRRVLANEVCAVSQHHIYVHYTGPKMAKTNILYINISLTKVDFWIIAFI